MAERRRPPFYTNSNLMLPILLTLTLAAVGVPAVLWFGIAGLAVALSLSSGAVVFLVLRSQRGVARRLAWDARANRELQRRHFQQTEALLSVFAVLQPRAPLPQTREKFAASPDFLRVVLTEVLTTRPSLVVEASCGLSTLIIAGALKQLGAGRVVSMEHDVFYAEQTRSLLRVHGLDGFATVVHAPLVPFTLEVAAFDRHDWQWYDVSRLRLEQSIDLLIIDGPPSTLQPFARFPALPILWNSLRAGARIILDDGDRPDERAAVAAWCGQFPELSSDFLDLEKGAFVLSRTSPATNHLNRG